MNFDFAMLLTWLPTVRSLRMSPFANSRLLLPAAIRRRTVARHAVRNPHPILCRRVADLVLHSAHRVSGASTP